jgi:hypothetical protein
MKIRSAILAVLALGTVPATLFMAPVPAAAQTSECNTRYANVIRTTTARRQSLMSVDACGANQVMQSIEQEFINFLKICPAHLGPNALATHQRSLRELQAFDCPAAEEKRPQECIPRELADEETIRRGKDSMSRPLCEDIAEEAQAEEEEQPEQGGSIPGVPSDAYDPELGGPVPKGQIVDMNMMQKCNAILSNNGLSQQSQARALAECMGRKTR